jgi:lysophospholipase L1-like esterase
MFRPALILLIGIGCQQVSYAPIPETEELLTPRVSTHSPRAIEPSDIPAADTDVEQPDDTSHGDTGEHVSDIDLCFADIASEDGSGPDYDQYGPIVGTHCSGTDHQNIQGVERVVFLGDSVTVGTPPTESNDYYRNRLASDLAATFGLESPDWWWETVNVFDGTTIIQESGDFASCAKWGARADDLMRDNTQIDDCFAEDQRDQTTLVVMTVGGNDLQKLSEGFLEGQSHDELWSQTEEFMGLVRDAVEWFTPERFPNGVYVIFTNLYEYTDATGDMTACPGAALAGYEAIEDPELEEMVVWAMEEFMSIAVDTSTDMLFLLESFCGHGYRYDDASNSCYRGASAELWFDDTCIHPNKRGHEEISKMFLEVVTE